MGIINNTHTYIPLDFIKDIYFTDIKNKDGSLIHYNLLFLYGGFKNGIIFKQCDKPQNNKSYIELVLINGNKLRTTRDREIIVI